jgi:hypothetical protein
VTALASGRLRRVTEVFGFVEAPLDRVVDPYTTLVATQLGIAPAELSRRPVAGPLTEALGELEPLRADSSSGDRHLLAPTASDWVAYFENAIPGDPRLVAAELPDLLGCRTLVLYATTSHADAPASTLKTVGFTLSAPGHAGMLDALRVLIVDADEPQPQTYGHHLPFEDADPRDLRPELNWLTRYCAVLGLHPFDPGFYFPPSAEGVLVAHSTARAHG